MRTRFGFFLFPPVVLVCLMLAACPVAPEEGEFLETGQLVLSSPAFGEGDSIPVKYTGDGDNVSPPLAWTVAPELGNVAAFALLCEDRDAPGGVFYHWVYSDLPAETRNLEEAVAAAARPPQGGTQGVNDFGSLGYGGPLPPRGQEHRYTFRLFALDAETGMDSTAEAKDLLEAIEGSVLAESRLVGLYAR